MTRPRCAAVLSLDISLSALIPIKPIRAWARLITIAVLLKDMSNMMSRLQSAATQPGVLANRLVEVGHNSDAAEGAGGNRG
jgi:hypothetical protein